jgi:hypothetical protein
MTGEEFLSRLDYYANAWLPARDLVVSALAHRTNVDPNGKILLFEQYAPWKVHRLSQVQTSTHLPLFQEHLFELETELYLPEDKIPIYVIYADETGGNYRIQAVPVSPESFESRKALPEAWRGLRDDELSQATGVDGGIFVHASGFIGGECLCYGLNAVLTGDLAQEIKQKKELWHSQRRHSPCRTINICINIILRLCFCALVGDTEAPCPLVWVALQWLNCDLSDCHADLMNRYGPFTSRLHGRLATMLEPRARAALSRLPSPILL